MKPYPRLRYAEPSDLGTLRLFFAVGKFIEIKSITLPDPVFNAEVIDFGMGLRVGKATEYSAPRLYEWPGIWLRRRPTRKTRA